MDETLIKELSRLGKNEKLLLVEALWDSIASDPEEVDVPEHHKTELEKRLHTIDEDKAKGISWEDMNGRYL